MQLDTTAWHRRLAVAVAVAALVLPTGATAALLVGPGDPLLDSVVTGIWVLKGVLLLHALLLWLAPGLETPAEPRGLLRDAGPSEARTASGLQGEGERETGSRAWAGLPGLIVAGLVLAALALRLPELGSGLWFDEVRTLLEYVRRSPGEILATFDSTNQHVLYSLAAWASVAALGESAAALRLPAVLFGVAGVWAVWWFGRRVAGEREALLAAALLAFSYHHVWFSQNARGYTALLFWTLVSTAFLVDLLRSTAFSWKTIAGYGVATALAIYTHLTAGAVLVAHAAVTVGLAMRAGEGEARVARRSALAGLVLAASLGLLLYAPVVPQAIDTLAARTTPGVAVEWENPLWLLTETAAGLARGVPGGFVTLGAGALVFGAGLVSYGRRRPAVTAAMVAPAALVLVAAVARSHNLWPRFFFFSAGFGVLIVVRGLFAAAAPLAGAKRRLAGTVLAVLLVGASAVTVPRAWGPKQDFRSAGQFLERARGPDDAVAALDLTSLPLREYLGYDWRAPASDRELVRLEGEHRTTWLVYTFPTRVAGVYPEIWRRVQEEYERVAAFPGTVRGGAVVIVRRSRSE